MPLNLLNRIEEYKVNRKNYTLEERKIINSNFLEEIAATKYEGSVAELQGIDFYNKP